MQKDVTKKTRSALKLVLLVGVAIIVLFTIVLVAIKSQNQGSVVHIRDSVIKVQIATTSQEKSKGLCCRKSLDQSAGMLFVYDHPDYYSFWMKDTLIPLDMVWISSSRKVVHIERDVQPSSYPKSYTSDTPARYILETNSGWMSEHDVKIGDTVQFDL